MRDKKEMRNNPDAEFRILIGENGKKMIRGYAAVFNKPSEILYSDRFGRFREIIKPGAFTEALNSGQDVVALFNHDANLILARREGGTLKLTEDSHGLRYEFEPGETSYALDLIDNIERGIIKESSFGFVPDKDDWTKDSNYIKNRELISVKKILDVSPVTYPAYKGTSVSHRNNSSSHGRLNQFEKNKLRLLMMNDPLDDRVSMVNEAQIRILRSTRLNILFSKGIKY